MENISAKTLKERMDAGEQIHLLDVREEDERAEYNIGGYFLPLGEIMSMQTEGIDDWKDEEVVVYCHSGKRSIQASMMLETMGFTNVKNLEGGILSWKDLQP